MRGGIWIMACVVVVIGAVTHSDSAVTPNGTYSISGKYTWKHGSEIQQGTHSGTMTLNNMKFYGNTTASGDGGKAKCLFTLSRRPSARSNSSCTVTGTITTTSNSSDTYNVISGTLYFKITSNNRLSYSGVIKGKITSGSDAGAVLALSCKGVK